MQQDLREYLRLLDAQGQLDRTVSMSREELAVLQYESSRSPRAQLVDRVEGYNYRFLTNLLADRNRLAGLLSTTAEGLHSRYLELLDKRISPITVTDAPVQEEVYCGEQADLNKLPALTFSREDAGPYITAGLVLASSPENSEMRNVSFHRMQVQGKRQLGIRLEASSHLLKMYREAAEKSQDLPVAIAIGCHPAEVVAAGASLSYGEDELGLAGAIRGEAVETIPGITVDVRVPAQAEIVIEGFIPADAMEVEGPFGDFQGVYVDPGKNHVVRVSAITRRREAPIFQSIRAGSLEDALLLGLAREVQLYKTLREAGHQVQGISLSPMVFNGAISLDKRYEGEPEEVFRLAFTTYPWLKYLVVTDTDVNIYDLQDVWWAMAVRSNPATLKPTTEYPGFARDPHGVHTGKAGIDATVPLAARNAFRRARP